MTTNNQIDAKGVLKPCPFCGSEAKKVANFYGYIKCSNRECDLSGWAIKPEAWNTRATATQDEALRVMRDALLTCKRHEYEQWYDDDKVEQALAKADSLIGGE